MFLWQPCVADADIIFLPRGFFFLSSFFLAYSQPMQIAPTSTHGCRSQTCCTRLAEIQDAKIAKKSPSAHYRTSHNFVGLCLRNEATYRQSKKNLLNSNIFPTCPHNTVNVGHALTAEIGSVVWAPQLISTGFASCLRYCSDVAHRKPTKLARCLAVSMGK